MNALRLLNEKFLYKKDDGESWNVLKDVALDSKDHVRGDCEDYSLTYLWLECEQSMWRFWWKLISLQYIPWFCNYRGDGHLVLYSVKRRAWLDNIQRKWVRKLDESYELKYPVLTPLVFYKFMTN